MIIEKKVVVTKEVGFTDITLLSIEEAESLSAQQMSLPSRFDWWLRSPASGTYIQNGDRSKTCVAIVEYGSISRIGEFVNIRNGYAIRPSLKIADPKNADLAVGDKFDLAGESWTVIPNGYALMDDAIKDEKGQVVEAAFRACALDWARRRAITYGNGPIGFDEGVNDFETSDIKKLLNEWACAKGIAFVGSEEKAA